MEEKVDMQFRIDLINDLLSLTEEELAEVMSRFEKWMAQQNDEIDSPFICDKIKS